MKEKERSFDEGFDNILTYEYDTAYKQGRQIVANDLLHTCDRKTISLNGQWHFAPDVFDSAVRSRWFDETRLDKQGLPLPYDFDFDTWEEVTVPGVWNQEKAEYALYEGPGLYIREFCHKRERGKRIFLRVGAANYETKIFLNRQFIGRHLGGFTPFMIDITEYLQEHNRLLLSVDNTRRGEQIPSLHYDWFNYGGIHRDVELIEVPDTYVQRFQLFPDADDRICYHVRIAGIGQAVKVEIAIPELGITQVQEVSLQEQKQTKEMVDVSGTLEVAGEQTLSLWCPENPKLYCVTVRIWGESGSQEEMMDKLSDRIGFRRIETKGTQILLNGKAIFLKGICVHEESPAHLRAVSEEDIRQMLSQAKELGCNFLRLTHYPHHEAVARIADEMGIMLLEEIPVYWALQFDNPETLQDAKNQLSELICRDGNRASVIIWSIGNENPDSDARYAFMKQLADEARRLDRSRLIAAACLCDLQEEKMKDRLMEALDVIGMNEYYGWYIRDFSELERILNHSDIGKPMIITETGADAEEGFHSRTLELYSEENQAEIYRRQLAILDRYDYICGITPWILYDYASMRRLNAMQRGYNLKGIIGKDRVYKKMAYHVLEDFYRRK